MHNISPPPFRKLRGYAFDPSLSLQLNTAQLNNLIYKVEWEKLDSLIGVETRNSVTVPSGEYVEIIDFDPASDCFYPPVNLNDPFLLAQDGLAPSVSNPQFHQQMVYAVVMTTIKNFEQALGRKIQWGEHIKIDANKKPEKGSDLKFEFVRRLRVYPHALRQANAYYDPFKKALLFGYFPAAPVSRNLGLPGGNVFTCLSHDIVAHETTHALLDGLHRRYVDATHPDTRAFHEAFADIVALFQHFTFPEVLKHQIAETRGDLSSQNLLGQLAQQFGQALGNYGSLRDAIGGYDDNGQWKSASPNPDDYDTKMEFHERGSILVAAVFEAFINIYKRKAKSLLRLATGGTGTLPIGDIHPDLINHLANAAAAVAKNVLRICIRALDYCPHTDITFGDYLRAIITADLDMMPEDTENYRVAFIEAFQIRGIFPEGVNSMSIEELAYPNLSGVLDEGRTRILVDFFRKFKESIAYESDRETIYTITKEYIRGGNYAKLGLHQRINMKFIDGEQSNIFRSITGLLFPVSAKECENLGFKYSKISRCASYEVGNLWLANRVTPEGKIVNHVILTLAQKRGVTFTVEEDEIRVSGYFVPEKGPPLGVPHIVIRGGCTMIFDLDTLNLRYAIKKDISDEARMIRQYKYENGLLNGKGSSYFDNQALHGIAGPFAFMHSCSHK